MTETKRYQCRHIFTDRHRCGSPCLRHEDFCYYHHTTRRPVEDPRTRRARQTTLDLPMPEDRAAIQHAIGQILTAIATNAIDPRRAGLLLYGLQIASTNLPRQPKPTSKSQDRYEPVPQPIEEIITDPEQGLLAPQSEFTQPERPKSIMHQLLEDLHRDKERQKAGTAKPNAPAAKDEREAPATQTAAAILPTLQATEEDPATPSMQIGVKPFCLPSAPLRTNPRSLARVRPLQSGKKASGPVKSTHGNLAYRRDVRCADLRLRRNAGRQCSRASSLDPAGA